MKKLILIVLSLSFCIVTFAQERKIVEVTSFNTIEVHQSFKVFLTQSDHFSVTLNASDELFPLIEIKMEGNKLVIDAKKKTTDKKSVWKWRNNNVTIFGRDEKCTETAQVEVFITFPTLKTLDVSGFAQVVGESPLKLNEFNLRSSGSSKVSLDVQSEIVNIDQSGVSKVQMELYSSKLYTDLSGVSTLNLDLMQTVHSVFADLSGSSRMNINGTCTKAIVACSGASHINGESLNVTEASLDCSGASSIIFGTLQSLVVDASGASNVKYKSSISSTSVNVEKSGGASVYAY